MSYIMDSSRRIFYIGYLDPTVYCEEIVTKFDLSYMHPADGPGRNLVQKVK